ncbi:RHS repeat-associated core domain-containing protein [Photorhabdus laumondii]
MVEGSPDVFFEGQPVARQGDKIMCSDHPGPVVIAEGAKTVFANGKPIARLGHRTTCDANINSAAASIAITPQTGDALTILTANNKDLRWLVAIAGLLPLPLGRKGNGGKVKSGAEPTPSVKKTGCDSQLCHKAGEPVDVATGDFLQVWPVLALPGVLPLTLNRTYRSTAALAGLFGPQWADDWSQHLRRDGEETHFTDGEGVIYTFHTPTENVFSVNLHAGHYLLYGQRDGELRLFNRRTQQILSFTEVQGDKRRLSLIEDRNGNQTVFHYDEHHRLTRLVHADTATLALHYEHQQLTAIDWLHAEQRQRLVTCRYDNSGYLAECDTFQFHHLWHEYSPQGNMTRWHDTDKTDVTVRYDNAGRVTATTTPQGYWQDRFEYDDEHRVTTYFDAEGGCTRYHYNADGLVTCLVDPLGHETRTEWDFSHKVAETDPLGRITAYEYSPYGELTGLLSPTGDLTAYDYDEYGQLTQVTQPDGARWRLHYNEQGNLASVIDPQGRAEETRYGPRGEILRQVLPDGRTWRYGYERQQLSEIRAPDGALTRFDTDGLGRLLRVTDALHQQTDYHHSPFHASPAGSVSEIQLPDGIRQTIDYDSERRVSAVTDGEGRTTRYTYDAFDRLSRLIRPDGAALTFGYDRLTRLQTVTNETGETYRYTRDPAGRVMSETDFTGRTIHYQYDAAGRRLTARYPNHQLLRWCYTDDDRLTRQEAWQEEDDRCTLHAVTTYDHDAQGRLVRATNPDAVVAFAYDEAGRLTRETINGRAVSHQWDPMSGLPTGYQADTLPAVSWYYGLNGRLMQWQLDGHAPLQMQHDGLGREIARESAAGFIQSHAYTPVGLLAHQTAGRSSDWFKQTLYEADPHFPPRGSAVTRHWHYTPAYNVACMEDPRWEETRYGYNVNDQVVTAQFGGPRACDEQFVYDAGQHLHYQKRVPERLSQDLRQSYHTQQAGRVIQHGACTYRYDENGRRTEKTEQRRGYRPRTWRYRWDAHDRLTGFISPEGTRWRYGYDAFGRRISKRQETDDTGQPVKPTAIIGYDYLWSGEQLIEETPVYADGTVGYEQSIHWLYEPGALTPSARFEKGQLYYVVSDHQGTVREILTEEGELIWAGRLLTWGEPERWPVLTLNDPRNLTCHLRFCGQYEDTESGLFYNHHRYYDRETGQYLSTDPLGLNGGENPYAYVHNPANWIDPFGLAGKNCQDIGNKSKNAQEMAEELANQLNKNTVTFSTPATMGHIDLRGRAHFDKITQTDIPTPHVQTSPINIAPNGKRFPLKKQEVARPATKQDIRTARELAKKQGILK